MSRLMRFTVALLALVALSGCAIERLTGPQVDLATVDRTGSTGSPQREDDPPAPPNADPGTHVGAAGDTLRAGEDLR